MAAGLINLIAGYCYCARVNLTGLLAASRARRKGERRTLDGRRVEGWGAYARIIWRWGTRRDDENNIPRGGKERT